MRYQRICYNVIRLFNSKGEHIATFECLERVEEPVWDWCLVKLTPRSFITAEDFAELMTFLATEASQ